MEPALRGNYVLNFYIVIRIIHVLSKSFRSSNLASFKEYSHLLTTLGFYNRHHHTQKRFYQCGYSTKKDLVLLQIQKNKL